jgi:gluconolactonase
MRLGRRPDRRIVPLSALMAALVLASMACRKPADPLRRQEHVVPEQVAAFPGYTEGIAFDDRGIAYISSGRNPESAHAVYRMRPGARPEVWLPLRVPNGHKVLEDGTHVIAGDGRVLLVTADGQTMDSITADRTGAPLRHPNDIALDGHGGFYLSDPGSGDPGRLDGRVLYRNAERAVANAADGFCYPNGLVVRADGRALYLDDSCDGRVYRLPIVGPGRLGRPEVLAVVPDSAGSGIDGLTLDSEGRLYVAHYGAGRIEVFDQDGHWLTAYAAGNRLASNVAFGGPGLRDLYVTGSPGAKSGPGALFRLRLGVRGRASMARPDP